VHIELVAYCYVHMNCIPVHPVANLTELYILLTVSSHIVLYLNVSFIFTFRDSIYEYNMLTGVLISP